MDFNAAEADLRKFVEAAWNTAGFNTSRIAWPDTKFTIPAGQTWCRFNCNENDGRQVSMGDPGNNRFRQFGLVILQIFQPFGQGSKDARTKAAAMCTALKGATTTAGVVLQNVYSRQIGDDGKGFYQINVVAGFYYDEIT